MTKMLLLRIIFAPLSYVLVYYHWIVKFERATGRIYYTNQCTCCQGEFMNNAAPETLTVFLARLRHQELRAIMVALGLGRRATENQKAVWVAAIAAGELYRATHAQSAILRRGSMASPIETHRPWRHADPLPMMIGMTPGRGG